MAKKKWFPSAKQAKIYVELREIGATPSQARIWVQKRVTPKGNIRIIRVRKKKKIVRVRKKRK